MGSNIQVRRQGFTIVELIVVVAVISILAAVGIISFGAWRSSITIAQIKSDLTAVAGAMESAKNFNNGYPLTLPVGFAASNGVTLTVFSASGSAYCINGTATDNPDVKFYISNVNQTQGPQEGDCTMSPDLTPPASPVISSATASSTTALNVAWSSVMAAVSYDAQCATDQAFILGRVSSSVTAPTTNAAITGLVGNTTYHCRVRAVNNKGASAWSATVTSNTNMVSPTGLAAATVSASQLSYSWNAVPGASGYKLQYAKNAQFNASPVTITTDETSGTISGLESNAYYFFRVRAIGPAGDGPYSTTAEAATTRPNWSMYPKFVGVGDWDADGDNDFMGYRSDGSIYLHKNNGSLSFQAGRFVANIGTNVRNLLGPGKFPGDTLPILFVTYLDGTGRFYKSDGNSGAEAPVTANLPSGQGTWADGDAVFTVPRLYSDGRISLLIKSSALFRWTTSTAGVVTANSSWGSGWSSSFPGDRAFGVDWNNNGYGDIFGITSAGLMYFYNGLGDGTAASGVQISSGWTSDIVFNAYDVNGDNKPDILRYYTPSTALCLYTGDGGSGFSGGGNCSIIIN